jgi:transposase
MMTVSPKHRVFLAVEPIDFRKGINGIATLCKYKYQQEPMGGHYFIFRNRRKTAIKILFYDAQGYCLFQKCLSDGKFNYWPTSNTALMTLTPTQLSVLINKGDPQTVITEAPWHNV